MTRDRAAKGERRRFRFPVLLLLVSILATAAVAFQLQRAVRSQSNVATALIHDHNAVAAWVYQGNAAAALHASIVSVLNPMMHYQREGWKHEGQVPDARWFVDHYIDSRSGHFMVGWPIPAQVPRTYFGFGLGGDTIAVRGDTIAPAVASAIHDTLTTHVRRVRSPSWDVAIVAGRAAGEEYALAYTLMPTVADDTIVYAFVLDGALLSPVLQKVFDTQPALPASFAAGRPNNALLSVSVMDAGDQMLYRAGPPPGPSYFADHPLPPQYGGLFVRASIHPDVAARVVSGAGARGRLAFLLGLLALAALLSLVAAAQLRREGELARLRSDFVSSVSHELRTPLAQIRLFVDTMLLGRATTEESREWSLGNIDRETSRLSQLVENVLLFSRLGHGTPLAPAERADVAAEVRAIVASFEPLAAGCATFDLRLDPVVVPIRRECFRQVILNLLDNAVKYGPAGQTITVRVERTSIGARVTVEDQGPGVSPADRPAIWEPFRRGTSSSAQSIGGGGIGLSIVRDVIEQHGGRVRLEDAARGGAAFVIDLPEEPPGDGGRERSGAAGRRGARLSAGAIAATN